MPVRRSSGAVVVPVVIGRDPEWPTGPLPLSITTAAGFFPRPDSPVADRSGRLTYFEPRVAEALYGSTENPCRWHTLISEDLFVDNPLRAVELLATSLLRPAGLAIFHFELGQNPHSAISRLAVAPRTDRDVLMSVLPQGVTIPDQVRRGLTISFVTFGDAPPPVMPSEYDMWKPQDQWLWLMASAVPFDRYPPDPEDTDLFAGRLRLSATWQALVLRDGIAFVGTTADSGATTGFHASAQMFTHSLYLDVLLLGALQISAYNELSNRLARLDTLRLAPGLLADLEERLIEVRNVLGADHVTVRGHGNELLERYRAQHRAPQLLARLVEDLTASARYVEAVGARQFNAVLGLITVLGLPFGLSYAAGALWGDGGTTLFLSSTGAAAALALALVVIFPQVRGLLRDLRARRGGRPWR